MASVALKASAELAARVRRPSLLKKLAKTEDLLPLFPDGAYVGWSGFTGVGYPK
jgi:acetyl-CoA hydrolase